MNQEKIELFDEKGASRGFYDPQNRLNDLTGREWVYWTKSVITNQYPPNLQHRLRSRHGAQKPPDLCADLIRVFTKTGETVFDPLAGVGGTLLGASRSGRGAVGVEINQEWAGIYHEVCRLEGIEPERLIVGEAAAEAERLQSEGFRADFVLTDVPYWQMDKARRSSGKYKRAGEAARERRPSKLSAFNPFVYRSKTEWLEAMEKIFAACVRILAPKRYVAVFIGDMYHSGRYHFLSADLAPVLEGLGLTMKANLVWYDVSKSLHVYGYRYEYIPSLIHQNILICRKQS